MPHRLSAALVLALVSVPARAHEAVAAHVHPHPDWTIGPVALLVAVGAAALLLATRRGR